LGIAANAFLKLSGGVASFRLMLFIQAQSTVTIAASVSPFFQISFIKLQRLKSAVAFNNFILIATSSPNFNSLLKTHSSLNNIESISLPAPPA
jgi:hypothetical protein